MRAGSVESMEGLHLLQGPRLWVLVFSVTHGWKHSYSLFPNCGPHKEALSVTLDLGGDRMEKL